MLYVVGSSGEGSDDRYGWVLCRLKWTCQGE